MKLKTILLLTALVICSSWAYPAGGNPDDDVELISGGGGTDGNSNQPGPPPSIPPVPQYPFVPQYPSIPPFPSIPTVPVYHSYPYPAYHPTYPSYPTYHAPSLFPFGWTYNVFDGFSNILSQIRNQATNAWSRVPSFKPFFTYWPSPNNNGTTTSTVKVVGDHKFIINETVHVRQGDFGRVVFKVRTVDVKPLDANDDTTEGVNIDDSTQIPQGDFDTPNTNGQESVNDDDDDRETVADTGDIDGNRAVLPEVVHDTNEIAADLLETFETEDTTGRAEGAADSNEEEMISNENANANEIKKQSLSVRKDEIEFESLSSESTDKTLNEWLNIELDNIDDKENTYYEVKNSENDSDEVEEVTYNLVNDIAVNQMLADQGAGYDPDAEVFDITQFEMNRGASRISSPEEKDSFDYLPYHHHNSNKRQTIIK